MENSFTIEQNLTFAEFFASTFNYYISGKNLRRFFLLLVGLSLLSMFLGIATTANSFNFSMLVSTLAPVLIMCILFLLFTFLMCLYIYKSKPYLFQNVSYDFTHWGVVRNGEKTEFSKPWREISNSRETKKFFLLYVANTDFHIIQKRMFKDFDEMERFRTLLNEKIV